MKLDMDLARQILARLEDDPDAVGGRWREISIEGRSPEEVSYHVMQLAEAGLVDAADLSTTSGPD